MWRAPAWRTTAVAISPIGTGPRDQHVLAEDREGERGVDRVAERVEDRGDLLVDARPVVPDVGHRQGDVLGERAVPPDAEADGVRAQVPPAREAVAAAAADDVALAADEVAGVEVHDVAADLDDLADELVADDQRRMDGLRRPGVPRLDVQVRPADPRLVDADQDVVDPDRRLRDLAQDEPRSRLGLDQGQHGRPVSSGWRRPPGSRSGSRTGSRSGSSAGLPDGLADGLALDPGLGLGLGRTQPGGVSSGLSCSPHCW